MRIALICPELHGHLNPMATLGGELARRGHAVTFFGSPSAAAKAARCGLAHHPVAVKEHESGDAAAATARLAELSGVKALKFTVDLLKRAAEIGLRDLPDAMKAERIEAVVVDQVSPAGGVVAELLGLPLVMACNAIALHQDPAVPPALTRWPYKPGWFARLRNGVGNFALVAALDPVVRAMNAFRRANGLPLRRAGSEADYGLAHVAQQPAFFDYPRERLPTHFHYTGPWHAPDRDSDVTFPWAELSGGPVVYASLGTMQNRLRGVFEAILEGCSTLPVQVVLSLGRRDAEWDGPVPPNAIVVPFAPQLKLLEKAAVVVTHAGLNTALETLAAGKPMLCLPITNDQPGVAGRVAWLGAGEVLDPKKATAGRVRAAVERLLTEPSFRERAAECRAKLVGVDGAALAADVVERAFSSGKRVERNCVHPPTSPRWGEVAEGTQFPGG